MSVSTGEGRSMWSPMTRQSVETSLCDGCHGEMTSAEKSKGRFCVRCKGQLSAKLSSGMAQTPSDPVEREESRKRFESLPVPEFAPDAWHGNMYEFVDPLK